MEPPAISRGRYTKPGSISSPSFFSIVIGLPHHPPKRKRKERTQRWKPQAQMKYYCTANAQTIFLSFFPSSSPFPFLLPLLPHISFPPTFSPQQPVCGKMGQSKVCNGFQGGGGESREEGPAPVGSEIGSLVLCRCECWLSHTKKIKSNFFPVSILTALKRRD